MLRPIWKVLHAVGAIRFEPHEDSGGMLAIFPAQSLDVVTAGELADKLWLMPALCLLAEPTPFRAGRIGSQWWISFTLKESPNGQPV